MENKEIAEILSFTAKLLELHDSNIFKINAYKNAAFQINTHNTELSILHKEQLQNINGVGKNLASKIYELFTTGTFDELQGLIENTPLGVIQMLNIRGLGPKKTKIIWLFLQITSVDELLQACNENKLIKINGLGEKTQENIKKEIEYSKKSKGKYLLPEAESKADQLLNLLKTIEFIQKIEITGDLRRKHETIDKIEFLVATTNITETQNRILQNNLLVKTEHPQSDTICKCTTTDKIPVEIHFCKPENFYKKLFFTTGNTEHLSRLNLTVINDKIESEEAIYNLLGFDFIPPEIREGAFEFEIVKNKLISELIEVPDLKGIIHNHTTYSDGKHTLAQMADHCKDLGYGYIGISDHSKSAIYAKGLKPDKVIEQHKEIDNLNKKLAPFKIFKGIESDILSNGSLDYDDDVLKMFDFIIASVHSNLNMPEEKATQRLIKAIENPYTTMLGHLTGRLLLQREGYPVNYMKVIDACAANNVIIEFNANPKRLELDWHWIQYALNKNVMLSINPDAHRMEGFKDLHYGVCIARKGGLTKQMTFNALSKEQVEKYFYGKKHKTKGNKFQEFKYNIIS